MRAVIIGNGDIKNYGYIKSKIRHEDFIICADGGIRHAKAMSLKIDIALGDFDSYELDEDIKHIVYPVRKDFIDGEIAMNYAIEHNYDEVLMLGMTGTRLDHTLTNIMLLTKHKNAYLIDDNNEIRILHKRLVFEGYKGKTLSVIPISENVSGLNSVGLDYPLNDTSLRFATGMGNSNVIIDDYAEITIEKGVAVVITNNGD